MNCHQITKKIPIQEANWPIEWHRCSVGNIKFDLAISSLPLAIAESTCRNCLTSDDQAKAAGLADPVERSHFIGRRLFQEWFASELSRSPPFQPESRLTRDAKGAPRLPQWPQVSLSFSATPNWAAAAACQDAVIGIDIEELRPVENAAALAQRFFSVKEAERLQTLPLQDQSEMFLRLWSAKEACLKAVGLGMVYGPERVQISGDNSRGYTVEVPEELGPSESWQLLSPNFGVSLIVSVALRPR